MNQKRSNPIGLTIIEAARLAGVGRSSIYEELASGRLRARKLGRRTIIAEHDLRDWLDGLPSYPSAQNNARKRERQ